MTLAGVLECPVRQETFEAGLGRGAFRNGVRLAVGPDSEDPSIGGPREYVDALPPSLRDRIRRASYIPSLAYRLAMVAEGSLSASFVKPNSHDWDLAAADLILREAGGNLLDEHGERPTYAGEQIRHGALVAGSGELLSTMASIIKRHHG